MQVVVADNSRTLLKLLQRQIQERGDCARVFSDGLEASDYIQSHPDIDVLLTSLELKSRSGLELCWDMRVNGDKYSSKYVIVMSSSSDLDKMIEALDIGADDYLQKPFKAEELYARLRSAERVLSAQRELVKLATIDPLTGVSNRRSFFDNSRAAMAGLGAGVPVSVIMLDIDHFKGINDIHGHDAGDAVLRAMSSEIGTDCPIFGRLGGEEFAAVLIGSVSEEAYDIAEVMRLKVSRMIVSTGGKRLSITCSIGISERERDDEVDELLRKADMALYAAKRGGRNRTVIFTPDCEAHVVNA